MSEMNFKPSPLMLLGIGGAGGAIASGVARAYSGAMRMLVLDTDARSTAGANGQALVLLGANRLSGHGAGGNVSDARAAVRNELGVLDERMTGVRTAVIVAGLGGGTGGGVAVETIQHLRRNGVATLLFATMPFSFEGEACRKRALSVRSILEAEADISVFVELDKLVATTGTDNMTEALRLGTDTLAAGITLLWRLLEKPGYIRLDPERLRKLMLDGGPARFATATATGENRAEQIVSSLKASPLLNSAGATHTRAMIVGVLAGNDLRLAEVGLVANELQFNFAANAELALGTVNDEDTFSGRLTVVVLLFGASNRATAKPGLGSGRFHGGISNGPQGRGRFHNAEKTIWNGMDLDVPTYLRQNITLDR
jgi:cell division protein FtsZ